MVKYRIKKFQNIKVSCPRISYW